jgi:S1-C subfamily serine protease
MAAVLLTKQCATAGGNMKKATPKVAQIGSVKTAEQISKLPHKKYVVLKPKHSKAYRKRHYAFLLFSVALAFLLFGILISLRIHIVEGGADSRQFIASTFSKPAAASQLITSSYGFNFSFDPRHLYASAIDGSTGKLYIGYELASERPYQTIKLSAEQVPHVAADPDSITIDYHQSDAGASKSLPELERQFVIDAQTGQKVPTSDSTVMVSYNGILFQKTTWSQTATSPIANQLTSHFISYTALVNGHPLIVRTNNQLHAVANTKGIEAIVRTINVTAPIISYRAPVPILSAQLVKSRSLLDTVLFSQASAAEGVLDTQTISALYAPSVVKIYNAYCTDISLNNKPYLSGACSAESGSGFFVSSDGYIATNGHVATENAKDLVIQDAYTSAAKGDGQPLVKLAQIAGLDLNKLQKITDDATLLDTIFNAVYNMPETSFTKTNNVQNLLVGLDSKDPDINKLLDMTNARKQYAGSSDIVQAKLVAADYRATDGIIKYRNSDVALIKLDGNNYPVTKLGDIAEVSQGSSLSILGYPAAASDNGIVASNVSEVTLTTGKVSSIKNANGDSRQLIETDTTIGHGNSGGPVLDDSGNVIGIATYTIDGGGAGNGTFNYVRDIADLKALASKNGIRLNTVSQTQLLWQQAIAAFNTSHYSKALQYFNRVRVLYPQHPTVDSFVTRSESNIQAGKDVKDFPIAILAGGVAIALVLVAVAVALIIRHHGKHQVYKMANGQIAAAPNSSNNSAIGYGNPLQPGQPISGVPTPENDQTTAQQPVSQQVDRPQVTLPFIQPSMSSQQPLAEQSHTQPLPAIQPSQPPEAPPTI